MNENCVSVLKLVADLTRWRILFRLRIRPENVSSLAKRICASRHSIRRHLQILNRGNVLSSEKRGREMIYSILPSLWPGRDGRTLDFGCCSFQFHQAGGKN